MTVGPETAKANSMAANIRPNSSHSNMAAHHPAAIVDTRRTDKHVSSSTHNSSNISSILAAAPTTTPLPNQATTVAAVRVVARATTATVADPVTIAATVIAATVLATPAPAIRSAPARRQLTSNNLPPSIAAVMNSRIAQSASRKISLRLPTTANDPTPSRRIVRRAPTRARVLTRARSPSVRDYMRPTRSRSHSPSHQLRCLSMRMTILRPLHLSTLVRRTSSPRPSLFV